MKRKLSILLACAMLMSCITPAFAENVNPIIENQEVIEKTVESEDLQPQNSKTEKSDALQPQEEKTEPTENEPTESTEQNSDGEIKTTEQIISELPVSEEYSEEQELPEEETTLSEDESYFQNIVVFTIADGTDINDIEKNLEKLKLREITPVFTNEDGTPKAMGKKNEIWYRAYTSRDAGEVVTELTKINGVTYAEPEYVYTTDSVGEPTETEKNTGWIYDSLLKLDSKFWWYTALNHDFAPGKDTIVAVIDTGVDYTHEDLAANMWINEAELNGTPGVDDDGNGIIDDIYGADMTATGAKGGNPMDDNGHGTHVAGIIGMSPNGVGGVGLAYGTKIMAIKAGQSTGTFSSSSIAKAIDYAHMMGADVINMSFGGTSKSYLIETALEDAFSDCVLVASAGNNGRPTTDADTALYPKREDIYPAGYTYVLGVMATDRYGRLASFSNWDYNPNANCEYELTAPGVDIYSTLPGNRYAKWNGTSMAAPCVSAAAAIIRSNYPDKSMYSARFIMGQLASATKDKTSFAAPMGEYYSYPALNIYDSIKYLPKPNITVKDTFLTDNKEIAAENDGDSIIDAGETIDLGVLVRNQWGLTGDITVKADAISVGGVANPYIEFITDEVTLEPAGTFQEVNNGYVYDDGLLTSVSNPIRFKVAQNTPNDAEICINITVTTTNGADSNDKATYEVTANKTFRVQAGRGISGTLTEDTTLTNDYLWVIENSLYVPEGITLTIEPGTKVQFYSSDYEDAYGGKTIANIICSGTLNAIGTENEPIEMYPGTGFEDLCVEIYGEGMETLKYCKIINPGLGYTDDRKKSINIIDHCELMQQRDEVRVRYFSPGDGKVWINSKVPICAYDVSNSIIRGIRQCYSDYNYLQRLCIDKISRCLFENCDIIMEKATQNAKVQNVFNLYLPGKRNISSSVAVFDNVYNNDENWCYNAILNPVLNNNPETWSKLTANAFNADYAPNYVTNNYWGTENKTLINKMITDADDYAGTYQDIIEDPILTLDSPELENIYPFVTKVYMTDSDGNIVSNVSSGETYDVHVLFNRDMAQDIMPSVTFGGEAPYTDYAVSGDFVSAREWVGSVKISPVLTGGTMYWRTKGGAAADDKWLVCGEDVLRFSFNIGSTGALAMVLNADGGTNKVDLSWAQNDYETLAGYNIYRSEKADSGFKKINLSVVTDTCYTDTDVKPGVTYYYYFKVVNTDGNEEEHVSNTASAAPIDNIYPILKHSPITTAKAASTITITATATDNIGIESVKLYYRKSGDSGFNEQKMTKGMTANLYATTIPSSAVKGDAIEYYIAASDADGNITYNGTANIPNVIAINSAPYILSITPTNIAIYGGRTITILGGNFSEDMTVKVGGVEISEKSFVDQGQINFVAPTMASGTYAVTLIGADGKAITAPKQLSYTDLQSTAEIPTTMTMTAGVEYTIPFYATASGDIISIHAELDLPTGDFSSVKVEKANKDANFTLDYSYSDGVLKIGCIGSSNINGDGALLNIIVVPKAAEDKQYTINLHNVAFNGVAVANIISGEVILKPNFILNAFVEYFNGTNNFVKNVTISAAGVSGTTDADGKVELTVLVKDVVISAKRDSAANAVTAYDASLVLQSAIDKITLTENQKKAADVDGNGLVNEYDAALILQKAVRKIDAFPTSAAWIFVPSSIEKTLSANSESTVSFTAISLGDVDGSFKGDSE